MYIKHLSALILVVFITAFRAHSQDCLYAVPINGKWGFINKTGELVIQAAYNDEAFFCGEYAVVKKDEEYIIIDRLGNRVSKPWMNEFVIAAADEDDIIIAKSVNGLYGKISLDGTIIIPFEYDYLGLFQDDFSVAKKNGKKGVVDRNGNFTDLNKYNEWPVGKEGYYKISHTGKNGQKKTGLYNANTKQLIFPLSKSVNHIFIEDGQVVISNGVKGYSVLNVKSGKYIIDSGIYESIAYGDGKYTVSKNGRYGLLDSTGTVIRECSWTYPYVSDFDNGYAIYSVYMDGIDSVHQKFNNGILSADGEIILPAKYSLLRVLVPSRLFWASMNGKIGVVDLYGNEIIPFNYSYIRTAHDLILVQTGEWYMKDAKIGYYDLQGNLIWELSS